MEKISKNLYYLWLKIKTDCINDRNLLESIKDSNVVALIKNKGKINNIQKEQLKKIISLIKVECKRKLEQEEKIYNANNFKLWRCKKN